MNLIQQDSQEFIRPNFPHSVIAQPNKTEEPQVQYTTFNDILDNVDNASQSIKMGEDFQGDMMNQSMISTTGKQRRGRSNRKDAAKNKKASFINATTQQQPFEPRISLMSQNTQQNDNNAIIGEQHVENRLSNFDTPVRKINP